MQVVFLSDKRKSVDRCIIFVQLCSLPQHESDSSNEGHSACFWANIVVKNDSYHLKSCRLQSTCYCYFFVGKNCTGVDINHKVYEVYEMEVTSWVTVLLQNGAVCSRIDGTNVHVKERSGWPCVVIDELLCWWKSEWKNWENWHFKITKLSNLSFRYHEQFWDKVITWQTRLLQVMCVLGA